MNARFLMLLALIWMPLASNARSYCPPVSNDQIVSGTSDEGATLETAECTERFRQFVSETVAEVRASYRPFFEDVSSDPKTIDELARLIAREDLLATGWISPTTSISHGQSPSDGRLLQEASALLRAALTPEHFSMLRNYKQSLPTRELLKPLFSRLDAAGIPLGKEQLERAVQDVQRWVAGLSDRAHDDGGDDIRYCEQADAFANRRDAQWLAILEKSLDEKQSLVARSYFQQRAEQREKETAARQARAGDKPCTIVDF